MPVTELRCPARDWLRWPVLPGPFLPRCGALLAGLRGRAPIGNTACTGQVHRIGPQDGRPGRRPRRRSAPRGRGRGRERGRGPGIGARPRPDSFMKTASGPRDHGRGTQAADTGPAPLCRCRGRQLERKLARSFKTCRSGMTRIKEAGQEHLTQATKPCSRARLPLPAFRRRRPRSTPLRHLIVCCPTPDPCFRQTRRPTPTSRRMPCCT